MKTVPTVRLADTADAVVLPDLPEEIALAMTDIAGVAREGLLAMSVAAGMAVMAAMFEAEMTEACGPKGKHDATRAAVRPPRPAPPRGAGRHPGRQAGEIDQPLGDFASVRPPDRDRAGRVDGPRLDGRGHQGAHARR